MLVAGDKVYDVSQAKVPLFHVGFLLFLTVDPLLPFDILPQQQSSLPTHLCIEQWPLAVGHHHVE